ncbi:MAG: hypothetical protein E6Q33_01210 [Neisseriales bacterium]|nr:MAG: hypothetical protein E6Q33_01210 [Neisseriales bacterium]
MATIIFYDYPESLLCNYRKYRQFTELELPNKIRVSVQGVPQKIDKGYQFTFVYLRKYQNEILTTLSKMLERNEICSYSI